MQKEQTILKVFKLIYHCDKSDAQPEVFHGGIGFVKLGHSDKPFVKSTRKKVPAGKNFGAFFPRHN